MIDLGEFEKVGNGTAPYIVQELLGHKDVRTTMIYTHVNLKASGIVSPQYAVIKQHIAVES